MTVKRTCSRQDLAVELDGAAGERLRYEVSFRGARPVFTLVSGPDSVLLTHSSPPGFPGPWVLTWPGGENEEMHTLGMHFLAAASYSYTVTKLHSDGSEEVVKRCTYESDATNDVYFEPMTIVPK